MISDKHFLILSFIPLHAMAFTRFYREHEVELGLPQSLLQQYRRNQGNGDNGRRRGQQCGLGHALLVPAVLQAQHTAVDGNGHGHLDDGDAQ